MASKRVGMLSYWQALAMLLILILSWLGGLGATSHITTTSSSASSSSNSSTTLSSSSSTLSSTTSSSSTLSGATSSTSVSTVSSSSPLENLTTQGPIVDAHPGVHAGYFPLANYLIGVINQERSADKESALTFNGRVSAQQHANSMLQYGYVSSWDAQGYTPYIRYSIFNGTGSVEENVASIGCNCTTEANVENTLAQLQYDMTYNDTGSGNIHRDNTLDPWHTSVAIGLQFNATKLYLVEDFLDEYFQFETPLTYGDTAQLIGISPITLGNVTPFGVTVYFDDPANLTVAQLNSAPYSDGSGLGSYAGCVTSSTSTCPNYSPSRVLSAASVWSVTSTTVDIRFSLEPFIKADGPGVYTVVVTDDFENIVDISFFTAQ